jgi:hypothetical protein
VTIFWTLIGISNIVVALNCYFNLSSKLNIFITIGNLSKLGSPLILGFIRFSDPLISQNIKKGLCFKQRRKSSSDSFGSSLLGAEEGIDELNLSSDS